MADCEVANVTQRRKKRIGGRWSGAQASSAFTAPPSYQAESEGKKRKRKKRQRQSSACLSIFLNVSDLKLLLLPLCFVHTTVAQTLRRPQANTQPGSSAFVDGRRVKHPPGDTGH